jgi:hypothetical protein
MYMLERWPRPLLIGESGGQQLLHAAPVGKPPFSERELQVILARHPQLLPVSHFDPLFGPPVCIGREVGTGAGPLDLLYVSPSGYLTVVETKLWKSSEARRQVVAQIIDYTRRIVRWDYSHLEEAFFEYARQYEVAQRGLIPYVADHSDEDLDEMAFTDAINRNLRLGRLLLLIVGDGIREGVEEMTDYLQDAPNLQFTLGLVEIGCYSVTAGPGATSTLLVPRVVMRTAEVTRAIVQIEMSEEASSRITVTTATPPSEGERDRTTLSKTAFYELLQKSIGNENTNRTRSLVDRLVLDHEGLEEDFTTRKLSLRADLANGDLSMPLIYISTGGAITVYRWLAKKLSERGVSTDAVNRLLTGLRQIDGLFPARVNDEGQIQGFKATDKNASLANVLPKFSELERLLAELLQEIERKAAETA